MTTRQRPTPESGILGELDRAVLDRAERVVGVDEVGRGALAGPVVIGAVGFDGIPVEPRVRDSKRLSAVRRFELAEWIRTRCACWVVVEIWQDVIDRINILQATRAAMRTAIKTLAGPGVEAVVDHVELGDLGVPVHSITGADDLYFSVAAASILAKVHRDHVMQDLAAEDDRWSWSRNVGYGTQEHRLAIARFGRSYLHRRSFRVVPVLP